MPKVVADRNRLKVLSLLAAFFFIGGVLGAIGFKNAGYAATIPLALILTTLASVPVADDLMVLVRRNRTKQG
jgi:hypothetical protein